MPLFNFTSNFTFNFTIRWEIEILLSNVLLSCLHVKNSRRLILYHCASAVSLCLMTLCLSKKLQGKVPSDRGYLSKIHSLRYCSKKLFCMWRDAFWKDSNSF